MSKVKVSLEEAKKILKSDKVFYSGNDKFNFLDIGKYRSGITIEIPQEWNKNKSNNPSSPIKYTSVPELTDEMNIDFDGEVEVIFGKYRLSKNGKPVFSITEPINAKDVLISVSWGGAFNSTRGQYRSYSEETNALYFAKRSSNGGGLGCDYWILPVDFVKDRQRRDVKEILKRVQEEKDLKISETDSYLKEVEKERIASIENRDRVIKEINPTIEKIKVYNPEFEVVQNEDTLKYRLAKSDWYIESRYTDELINKLEEILKEEIEKKQLKDEYIPKYKEIEEVFKSLKITFSYEKQGVVLSPRINYGRMETYRYNITDYLELVEDINKYREKIEQEKRLALEKIEMMKRQKELEDKKQRAKDKGYPEKFEFGNRLSGATNLSHAYVITKEGEIREPDGNKLRNPNHKCRYSDWLNEADGDQIYYQILEGEVIVSYTKQNSSTPYILNVEWVDSELSSNQKIVICELFESIVQNSTDIENRDISSVEQWLERTIPAKLKECKEEIKDDIESEVVDDILEIAKKKSKLERVNAEAKELAELYEQQITSKV